MAASARDIAAGPGARRRPVDDAAAEENAPGLGYESPMEEIDLHFLAPSSAGASFNVPETNTCTRPPLLPRSSFVVALPPPPPPPTNSSDARARPAMPSGLDDIVSKDIGHMPGTKVSIRSRIACYQWTYFTMTMATGGVANVIHSLEYSSSWLTGIGLFFFLLNIILFLTNCICLTLRFNFVPGSLMMSFTHQFESLFIPAFFVSFATIMINICEYGVPYAGFWLLRTMQIIFWFYIAVSVLASASMYLILWSTQVFPVHTMTPTWVFPAYPLLLTAPYATNLIAAAERSGHLWLLNKPAIAICAVTTQGTGCLIAFMISAAFLYRLMTQKLPRDMQRPGVFISIGPFGFTAASVCQLGRQADIIVPKNFLHSDMTVDIFKVVSVLVGLWLWGLSMWFFLVSVGSLWKYVRKGSSLPFQMTWWSFVFPNTALVTATEAMGKVFDSNALQLCSCVMTAVLVAVWLGVFATMLYCLWTKRLLYPKQQE